MNVTIRRNVQAEPECSAWSAATHVARRASAPVVVAVDPPPGQSAMMVPSPVTSTRVESTSSPKT